MTYHELWRPRRLGRLAKLILLNAPHRVIVFSQWHADGVRRFRRLGPQADVIPVGSNIPAGAGGDRTLTRARYGIPVDATVLTFFGFLIPEHLLGELIGAAGALKRDGHDVRLSVIGEFEPPRNAYHQRLLELAHELSVEEVTTWHGRVEDTVAVARLIAVSDVGVLPYKDGVGENNGAFATLAAFGVPIVTTAGPRSGPLESEEVARFAVPVADRLADAITALMQLPVERRLLGERARGWARRRDWGRVAAAYLQVFDNVPTRVVLR
jgi:glycosyltransferase involved in cell wall biosynthesis